MSNERFIEEFQATYSNIVYLYNKLLEKALQENDLITAKFLREELGEFIKGGIIT